MLIKNGWFSSKDFPKEFPNKHPPFFHINLPQTQGIYRQIQVSGRCPKSPCFFRKACTLRFFHGESNLLPRKTRMEPENGPLKREIPIRNPPWFQVQTLTFGISYPPGSTNMAEKPPFLKRAYIFIHYFSSFRQLYGVFFWDVPTSRTSQPYDFPVFLGDAPWARPVIPMGFRPQRCRSF